ncbi:hypothetical protein BDW22DRAFT_1364149 [Trametopsis cervina]|nr:hypothetical protein BDW22DRAFT_1364149 [Trametopsis cervina]
MSSIENTSELLFHDPPRTRSAAVREDLQARGLSVPGRSDLLVDAYAMSSSYPARRTLSTRYVPLLSSSSSAHRPHEIPIIRPSHPGAPSMLADLTSGRMGPAAARDNLPVSPPRRASVAGVGLFVRISYLAVYCAATACEICCTTPVFASASWASHSNSVVREPTYATRSPTSTRAS